MRSLRPAKSRKEWHSSSGQPLPRDYFAWLESDWLQSFLYIALICTLGFFAQNLAVGMVLTGLYAASALILRLPSAATFRVALLGLIILPILTYADKQDLVAIYAQYVFLLLCVGTVSALVERRAPHTLEVGLPVTAKVEAGGRPAIITNQMEIA